MTAAAIPDGRGLRGCTAELAADTAAGRLLCRVLIMYSPATAKVGQIPLLIVPPTINKFYVLDLAPGRSLAEYLVRSGPQVFMISWRNPNARHARWDLDAERCGPEKAAPRNPWRRRTDAAKRSARNICLRPLTRLGQRRPGTVSGGAGNPP